ncbi:MAG: GNAT family N-acetyltransferase [Rhodoferax sp.]|nr:GNAT family N-acetyltransferase [Rhodoferax sp.]
MHSITIQPDDLRGAQTIALLEAHRRNMFEHSPPECVFALDLDALRQPEISLWTAWEGADLLGCGALKELNAQQGEIKSMRTANAHLRKGVAAAHLAHLIAVARSRRYTHLYLETGSVAAFAPARALYERHGFGYCGPFADYVEDPFSVFMVKTL